MVALVLAEASPGSSAWEGRVCSASGTAMRRARPPRLQGQKSKSLRSAPANGAERDWLGLQSSPDFYSSSEHLKNQFSVLPAPEKGGK